MVILDSTTISLFVATVLVVAAVGALAALVAVADFFVSNRGTRIARHQTVRTYYRGLALTH